MTWASGGPSRMEAYLSFKAYLVYKAQDSAKDKSSDGEHPQLMCAFQTVATDNRILNRLAFVKLYSLTRLQLPIW